MKFLLTQELGRLAKWLRILGFDAEYATEAKPGSLLILALRDERIILTRNKRLSQTISSVRIISIESQEVKEQLKEVLKRFDIRPNPDIMFSRCILCNVTLDPIDKDKVRSLVPEYVFKTQGNFISCPKCKRIYWQGTHWGNVAQTVKEIRTL